MVREWVKIPPQELEATLAKVFSGVQVSGERVGSDISQLIFTNPHTKQSLRFGKDDYHNWCWLQQKPKTKKVWVVKFSIGEPARYFEERFDKEADADAFYATAGSTAKYPEALEVEDEEHE